VQPKDYGYGSCPRRLAVVFMLVQPLDFYIYQFQGMKIVPIHLNRNIDGSLLSAEAT
ncbi:hypothetical protein H8959_001885, partial [Pygathrix nigripes]